MPSHLRIEVHILSLHWMKKNISYFGLLDLMFTRSPKIANVFHHPVQALKYEFQSLYMYLHSILLIKSTELSSTHPRQLSL